jgi:hypothetical protein
VGQQLQEQSVSAPELSNLVLIVMFGFIAAIVGALLIGYSFGLRAGKRKRNTTEATQSGDRSIRLVTDRGNVPFVEPTTDHERAIAHAVDEKFLGDNRHQPTLRDYLDISASTDFVMSASDSQFLVDYLNWRLTHPIRPLNSE